MNPDLPVGSTDQKPWINGEILIPDMHIEDDFFDYDMQVYDKLTLEMADKIANRTIECCKDNEFKPKMISVVNQKGNMILTKTMDVF